MAKINKIIKKYFNKEYPETVQYKFYSWLKHPFLFKEKEEALIQLWDDSLVDADESTEYSYKQIERKLGFVKEATPRFFYHKLARIAALFLIPLLSVFSAWFYVETQITNSAKVELIECYVPYGETRKIELPDGSHVLVNSGTTLFYNKEFSGKTREVFLSGEAKFMVSKDKKRAFIVKTNDMIVEALGTTFNINAYPENSYVAASLIEGGVKVDIKATDESFILSPKEQAYFDKETKVCIKTQARLDYVLAWENGQMVFQKVSLYTILNELERRFNITIYLNATSLGTEKLTVKFLYDETLEETLNLLQQIIPEFKYKIDKNKVYIY